MADVMPPMSRLWHDVESTAQKVFETYGYREIRTPILEAAALFRRGVGETTAIVEKEMYGFIDQGGQPLALRPEATASVVRAYIESGAFVNEPIARYYYFGPMFRRERPQRGRLRQFYQIGCELIGVESPLADAEMIAMVSHFLGEVGAGEIALEINSIGCESCRPGYASALLQFLEAHAKSICDDCIRRMKRNPMRALDCKEKKCRDIVKAAPSVADHWCKACREHFERVRKALDRLGIRYEVDTGIVRGLDYYMRTAFEFVSDELGAQNAIAAGGRYDGLVRALGGPDAAGIGFALGIERLLMLLETEKIKPRGEDIVFFAVLGERAKDAVLPIIQTLRRDGVCVEWDFAARSLKAQMRRAGRVGAGTVVIIGDDEIGKGQAVVRDMREQRQKEVHIKDLPMHFVKIEG